MHFLVIPKHRDGLTQLSKSEPRQEQLLGHLLHVAGKVALQGVLPNLAARQCHSLQPQSVPIMGHADARSPTP